MGRFLDELKKVGADVFQRGAKGVDAVASIIDEKAELGRLGIEMRRKNHQRDELIMAIGRKVYTLHTLGKVTNAELVADCQGVDSVSAEITALREQIEKVRSGLADQGVTVELTDDAPVDAAPPEPPVPPAPPVPPEPPVPEAPPAPEPPPVPDAPCSCDSAAPADKPAE